MAILRLRSDLVDWQVDEDGLVARDLRTSRRLGLNPTAAVLWQSLVVGATEADLIAELVERFDVHLDVATLDVASFLQDLHGRGLLTMTAP